MGLLDVALAAGVAVAGLAGARSGMTFPARPRPVHPAWTEHGLCHEIRSRGGCVGLATTEQPVTAPAAVTASAGPDRLLRVLVGEVVDDHTEAVGA